MITMQVHESDYNPNTDRKTTYGSTPVILRSTHHYQVVTKREENRYQDSDFYAVVPNGRGGFEEICYASTRGWTYANSARIDAPPSLIKEYKTWKIKQEIKQTFKNEALRWDWIKRTIKTFTAVCETAIDDIDALVTNNNPYIDEWGYVLSALARATRSQFRISLKKQVIKWLLTPKDQRRFDKPLSPRQFNSIAKYML